MPNHILGSHAEERGWGDSKSYTHTELIFVSRMELKGNSFVVCCNNGHVTTYDKAELDLLCCLLESGRHSGPKPHRLMSFQARTSQFRMTFLVADYIPSFHVPVDFPHKTQIVQPFQG